MMKSLLAAVFVSMGLGACAATMTEVPVNGTDRDVARLAGLWEGQYEVNEVGRRGAITFELKLGYHVAEGKVMMADGDEVRPLKIKFVKVAESAVSGKIDPYTDPACKCVVETEFTGYLDGDQIAGTFNTRAIGGTDAQSGTWQVTRTDR